MKSIACRTLGDVILFAVDREKSARDFYLSCMNRATTPGARTFFREMAEEEAAHMRLLMDMEAAEDREFALSEIDGPHLIDFMVDVRFSPEMSYQEALVMAMRKEKNAHAFYAAWRDRCGGAKAAQVFAFLAGEELKHQRKIEEIYEADILQWD